MAVAEKIQPEARPSVVSGYDGDTLVEVELGLVLGEERPEQAPWCVDLEGSIRCMSACQVLHRLATGQLSQNHMIWRDGYGAWVPIGDCDELEVAARGELLSDLDVDIEEAVEESQVRLRRDVVMRDMASYRRKRSLRALGRLPWQFFAATFAVAVGVFCVCYFPLARVASQVPDAAAAHGPQTPSVQPLVPRLLSTLERQKARLLEARWQQEQSWWQARWPAPSR